MVLTALLLVGCGVTSQPLQLRVLTYNIHHGQGTDGKFDLQRIASVINSFEADLVALQEVDRKTKRASGVDQAAELARLTNMNYAYGPAMEYSGGEYGEAILSRFPILEITNHNLPWGDGSEPRAVLVVRVDSNEFGEIVFAGTHLAHDSEADRIDQAKKINDLLALYKDAGVILAGDLNSRPDSKPMKVLSEIWIDAAATVGKPQPTFPSFGANKRIDYVLIKPSIKTKALQSMDPSERMHQIIIDMYKPIGNWQVVQAEVVDGLIASDHCPLLVVLEKHNSPK